MTPSRSLLPRPALLLLALLALAMGFALAQTQLELRLGASADDAEEFNGDNPLGPPGTVYLDSSDLEFVEDVGTTQVVGLRFAGLELPQGARIASAYVQFTAKETNDTPTALEIAAEASDDAVPFQAGLGDLSSRQLGAGRVSWTPPAWDQAGEASAAERTPDLAPLLQEVVDRPGWQSGGALVLIFTGSGHRTAWSVDGRAGSAPLLVVALADEVAPAPNVPETPAAPDAPEPVTPEPAVPEPAAPEPAAPTARAQQARYPLSPAGDAEIGGSLLIADYGELQVLTLLLSGGEVANRGAALRLGSCEAPGEAVLALAPTGAGGYSTTLVRSSFALLTQQDLQLSVYRGPDGAGEVLACGEVNP